MNFNRFPKKVRLIEVGPRDGLQSESVLIETKIKAKFIAQLASSGLKTIEATSFVHPKSVPQMGDADILYPLLKNISASLPCLVPNERGLERALGLGVKEIAVFTATSDSFNKKNINMTVSESLQQLIPLMAKAKKKGITIRGHISTAFGCPYEGATSLERLKEIIVFLLDKGADEVSLGDTIGCGTPKQVDTIIKEVKKEMPLSSLALHFHDTRGLALTNILVALENGVFNFDSSAGGLGGCPFAPRASGNVATEDVVYLLHSLGVDTGVDLKKVAQTGRWMLNILKRQVSTSRYLQYTPE